MAERRRVTEEDLHVTEALIAESYARLKRSVIRTPSQAIKPVADRIREHPFAAAAAAAGAGLAAYELVRLVTPRVVVREVRAQPQAGVKQGKGRKDLTAQLLRLAAPYIAGYLQQYLGRLVSGERR